MIEKFQEVDGLVSGGSMPEEVKDIEKLFKQGVKAIVSLEPMPRNMELVAKSTGMKVVKLPLDDAIEPTKVEVNKFLTYVKSKALRKEKVFVHCRYGIGRTREMLAFYLISKGMHPLRAYQTVGGTQTQRQKDFLLKYGQEIYEKKLRTKKKKPVPKAKPVKKHRRR